MSITRDLMADWVVEALQDIGGGGSITDICRTVWRLHGKEIEADDTAFYNWQYEIPWAGYQLRRKGILKHSSQSPRGLWELETSQR